jgi:hypothetical protein
MTIRTLSRRVASLLAAVAVVGTGALIAPTTAGAAEILAGRVLEMPYTASLSARCIGLPR